MCFQAVDRHGATQGRNERSQIVIIIQLLSSQCGADQYGVPSTTLQWDRVHSPSLLPPHMQLDVPVLTSKLIFALICNVMNLLFKKGTIANSVFKLELPFYNVSSYG